MENSPRRLEIRHKRIHYSTSNEFITGRINCLIKSASSDKTQRNFDLNC